MSNLSDEQVLGKTGWERYYGVIVAGLLAFAFAAGGLQVIASPWHGDEGFYMYAFRSFAQGKMPYVDFFHNQPPLLILTCGPLVKLLGASAMSGAFLKGFMLVLGFLGTLICCRSLARSGQVLAGCMFVALMVLSVPGLYLLATLKAYALTFFLTAVALYLLQHGKATMGRAVGFGALCGLAAAARLPLVPMVVGLSLYYPLTYGKQGVKLAVAACVSGGAAFWLVLLPFFIKAPAVAWYNMVTVNTLGNADVFDIDPATFQSPAFWLKGIYIFLSKGARDFGPILALVTAGWLALLLRFREGVQRERLAQTGKAYAMEIATTLGALMIIGMHLRRPEPYNEYFMFGVPLLAYAGASFVGKWAATEVSVKGQLGVLAATVAMLLSMMQFQLRSNLIIDGGRTHLTRLKEAVKLVHTYSDESDIILAHQTIAFVADRDLVVGADYPVASSHLSDADALRLHRLNPTLYVAAFDDPALRLVMLPLSEIQPVVAEKLAAQFDLVEMLPQVTVGAVPQDLCVFVRRPVGAKAAAAAPASDAPAAAVPAE